MGGRDSSLFFAPTRFSELLIRWNGLDSAGFAAWEFLPGMRFGERAAWWRDGGERGDPHEGLDLCWFRTRDGRRSSLAAGASVPTIWAGEVVAAVDDFLGISVFVAHERHDARGWRLHSIYGHIRLRTGLAPGSALNDEDTVGTIAAVAGRKSAPPPHLHLTLALIDPEGGPARLDWNAIGDKSRVCLLDPMIIMK